LTKKRRTLGTYHGALPMPERLSPSLQQAYEATRDRALKGAASVARDVRRPGRSLTARESPAILAEIRHAERLALRNWAERCGLQATVRQL
jgi:hypothetical protein